MNLPGMEEFRVLLKEYESKWSQDFLNFTKKIE